MGGSNVSDTTVIDDPQTFATRATELLKEYYAKIIDLKQELRRLHTPTDEGETKQDSRNARELEIRQAEHDSLFWYFNHLQPAIRDFNQQVSGMIDQGRLSLLTKSELRLRLAELESVISQMTHLMHAYRPK